MATTIVTTRLSGGGQPSNTYLTALSTISGTGIYVITGPNTSHLRTITGTPSQITVVNGDGVAGNPVLTLATDPVLPGNSAVTVPSGTTAQQSGVPTDGMIRYNTQTNLFEFYQASHWVGLSSGVSQIVAGTGIIISPTGGTGIVTISGSGTVTSIGLTSTDFGVSGSPITNAGNITVDLKVQSSVVAGTYPNADIVVNSKGIITNISAGGTSTIKLYTENYMLGAPNTITGNNSYAIGEDNTVTGHNAVALGVSNNATALGAVAIGNSSAANFPGQFAHASGKFAINGDAQGSDYIYRGETGTQYPIEIFLDGNTARLILVDNSAIAFEALAIARRIDLVGDYAAFRLEGLIKRDSGTGSTAIIGQVNKTIITRTNNNLDCNFQAHVPSGSLQCIVQGSPGAFYNWVVRLISVEEIG